MTTRRNFLIGASAGLICAPSIVRTERLVRLRGIILPTARGTTLVSWTVSM